MHIFYLLLLGSIGMANAIPLSATVTVSDMQELLNSTTTVNLWPIVPQLPKIFPANTSFPRAKFEDCAQRATSFLPPMTYSPAPEYKSPSSHPDSILGTRGLFMGFTLERIQPNHNAQYYALTNLGYKAWQPFMRSPSAKFHIYPEQDISADGEGVVVFDFMVQLSDGVRSRLQNDNDNDDDEEIEHVSRGKKWVSVEMKALNGKLTVYQKEFTPHRQQQNDDDVAETTKVVTMSHEVMKPGYFYNFYLELSYLEDGWFYILWMQETRPGEESRRQGNSSWTQLRPIANGEVNVILDGQKLFPSLEYIRTGSQEFIGPDEYERWVEKGKPSRTSVYLPSLVFVSRKLNGNCDATGNLNCYSRNSELMDYIDGDVLVECLEGGDDLRDTLLPQIKKSIYNDSIRAMVETMHSEIPYERETVF